MARVAVAMSGGVDSSVTAALLKQEGHDVIGITMQVLPPENSSVGEASDARHVAGILGIPYHVFDLRDVFSQSVIANFCEEYSRGRTPNPCVRCNYYVKFGALLEMAKGLGADFIATGHYARIARDGDRHILRKGIDSSKDQSYFLCRLTRNQLKQILMPLGDFTKERVRQIARDCELPVAERGESQEICFVPDDDYHGFITRQMPQVPKPGPILNRQGKVLGEHRGIINYTIGQRRGIGIAAGEPLYVTAIDAEKNTIVVGPKTEVYQMELIAEGVNWIGMEEPSQPIEIEAKIRYLHSAANARLFPLGDCRVHVVFARPQMAITPGQTVVFYQGDTVLGGGTIK